MIFLPTCPSPLSLRQPTGPPTKERDLWYANGPSTYVRPYVSFLVHSHSTGLDSALVVYVALPGAVGGAECPGCYVMRPGTCWQRHRRPMEL